MQPDVIITHEVKKSFRGEMSVSAREVLHGVSFFARQGEILGFLGPNGAGKTTTIKILLGLVRPDSGKVEIFERPCGDPRALRRIGYLPENPYFYPHLNLTEFLRYCARLSGLEGTGQRDRIAWIVRLVGLEGKEKQRLKSYSKGMLQRAGLAQAILHDPDLLILDEPFSGLDPIGRKMVRDCLLDLKKLGKTIFFSSHILPDMEAMCDRACMIRDGIIVKDVSLDGIFRIGEGKVEITARGCWSDHLEPLAGFIDKAEINGEEAFIVLKKQEYVRVVVQHIYSTGAEVLKVVNQHRTLEDIFMGEIESRGRVAVKSGHGERHVAQETGR